MQSNTGKLFRTTYRGKTTEIDLGGANVLNGDGIWLEDRTLYVVQNRDNVITRIQLDRHAGKGTVVSRTTDPRFDVAVAAVEYIIVSVVGAARLMPPSIEAIPPVIRSAAARSGICTRSRRWPDRSTSPRPRW